MEPQVVIVDDEIDVRLLLRLQLPEFGIDVVGEAENGAVAIDVCEATRPNVVVLDLLMPVMNGFEAIPKLRERCPDTAILAYSAIAGDSVREELSRLGVELHLKTGDPLPLVEAIRALSA